MRRRPDVDITSTTKPAVFTTSGYRRCIDVETRRCHDVDMTSTTKTDVFTTSGHRCCKDVKMRHRRDVEVTSTPKSDVFTTSGYRRCIDAESRRRHKKKKRWYDVDNRIIRLDNVGLLTLALQRFVIDVV